MIVTVHEHGCACGRLPGDRALTCWCELAIQGKEVRPMLIDADALRQARQGVPNGRLH